VRSEGPVAVFFIFGKDTSFNLKKKGTEKVRPSQYQTIEVTERPEEEKACESNYNAATIDNFVFFRYIKF